MILNVINFIVVTKRIVYKVESVLRYMKNTTKDKSSEEESDESYVLWMSNKITDKQYFRAINNLKSK